MKFKTILWDIDNTLLDFQAAEKQAIDACFKAFSLGICTEEMLQRYTQINHGYWKKLELGEMDKPGILVGRFRDFFREMGLPTGLSGEFNELYQEKLGDTCVFMDNAFSLVEKLKSEGFLQYAVTNGTAAAQERKLRNSGLDRLLDGVFISDKIGHEKPTDGFFSAVFRGIPGVEPEKMLLVGDSLSSDMRGGTEHGIPSVWYNPKRLKNDSTVKPDWEIRNLWEIEELLR